MDDLETWKKIVKRFLNEHIKSFIEGLDKELAKIDDATDRRIKITHNVADFYNFHAGLMTGLMLTRNILEGLGLKNIDDALTEIILDFNYEYISLLERQKEGEPISREETWILIREIFK